jgi:PAS domain S-box-containing protein
MTNTEKAESKDVLGLHEKVEELPRAQPGDLHKSSLEEVQGMIDGREVGRGELEVPNRARRRSDAILGAVSFAAERFLRATSWEESIREFLERLGRAAEVSRVYVGENYRAQDGAPLSSARYEWAAAGVSPQIANPQLQGFSWRACGMGRFEESLRRGRAIHGSANELIQSERELLTALGVRSVLVVPIFVDRHWWGYMGFDECQAERVWSDAEIDALKAASSILGAAIRRQQAEKALREARDELEQQVEQRTAVLKATNWELRHEIAQRTSAEEALRESEERLRSMFENTMMGLYRTAPDGHILMANSALLRMLGFSSFEELARRNLEEEGYEPGYPRSIFKQHMESRGEVVGLESAWTRRDGTVLFVRESARAVRDKAGKTLFYEGTVEDITERRRAEEEAQRRLDELAHVARLSTMGEMVSGLAHELSQPLAAIANHARACRYQIRALRGEGRQGVLDSVGHIAEQADRAGQIIRHLRTFARRADSSRLPADVNELIHDVTILLEVEMRLHDTCLELVLNRSLPEVTIDRIQIEQVVINLVRNAMEAMEETPKKERHVAIRTSCVAENLLAVAVEDAGRGPQTECIDRLFEPFYTTKASGMGLGLSISRSIIEAHGGRLEALPNAERGTTFRFTLPVEDKGDAR